MRIGHVVRQFAPAQGGLEEFVAQLSAQQVRSGHAVRVITCDRVFQNRALKLAPMERRGDIEVRRIPFFGSTRYPLGFQVLGHLADLDLVHVHGVDFFFDYLAVTRPLHRQPLVATVHGGFFHSPAYRRVKKLWFTTLTRSSCLAYDFVVANSISDFSTFSRVCGAKRLQLIENGVELDKLEGAASGAVRKRLVTIGRFSTNKRLDRLLDAFFVLVRRDPDWRLDVCGSDADWTFARLQDEVRNRGLDRSVALHASPPNSMLRDICAQSSFFVSASEYEGFGLAMVEAMSAGLLPVVHRNNAFSAFAKAHGSVSLADFSSPESAASAIEAEWRNLNANPDLRADTRRVASKFAWPQTAARYNNLYRMALAGNKNPEQD